MIYQVAGILFGVFLIGFSVGWLLRWQYFLWTIRRMDMHIDIGKQFSIK